MSSIVDKSLRMSMKMTTAGGGLGISKERTESTFSWDQLSSILGILAGTGSLTRKDSGVLKLRDIMTGARFEHEPSRQALLNLEITLKNYPKMRYDVDKVTGIIIQSRLGSRRLPFKAFYDLNGKPVLQQVIRRCKQVGVPVVLATPDNSGWLARVCQHEEIPMYVYHDSEDVLGRYFNCAASHSFDPVVRITADCPLIDPDLIKKVIKEQSAGKYDIVSLAIGPGAEELGFKKRFPDGVDVECFTFDLLEHMYIHVSPDNRDYIEHVTQWAWDNTDKINYKVIENTRNLGSLKISLDDMEDYELLKAVFKQYGDDVTWQTVIRDRATIVQSLPSSARTKLYAT